jgi:hypothetical protein
MDFKSLYSQHWETLFELLMSHRDLSNPLLLNFPEGYQAQPTKLFIVGQQTHSWYNGEVQLSKELNAIDDLMDKYKNGFRLGVKYRSPFWNAARKLEKLFKISDGQILWSNLNRVDRNKGRPFEIEKPLYEAFPVLSSEIEIAKPDVVVFFTGPYFDDLIALNFPRVKFEAVNSLGKRLVRVIHGNLPSSSFRTYHPNYMRRKKIEQSVLEMIREASKLCA